MEQHLNTKNRKNFINLCHHEDDFGVPAEWHFSATSHGKVLVMDLIAQLNALLQELACKDHMMSR